MLWKSRSVVVTLIVLLLFPFASFAAEMANQERNNASEAVIPTERDRLSVERFRVLMQQLDKPEGPARELANQTRNDRTPALLSALGSTEPVERRTLREARGFMRWVLPQLEAARSLTLPPPLIVKRRSTSIQIDGKLDEVDWNRASEVWIQYDLMKKDTRQPAKARILWDSRYLYVAFTVIDKAIVAPPLERDGEVWKQDCVEMFLLPDKRFGVYWEIEISPTGNILDYLCYKYRDRWGSDMRAGETLRGMQIGRQVHGTANDNSDIDEGYTVEVAVPFNQLPGMTRGPQPGDKMFALFCWVNRDSIEHDRTTSLAHVPFVSWFHNIWTYQPLVFSDKAK